MRRELRILLEIAGDVVLVLGMVIVASIGAGWCKEVLTPGLELYLGWFTLWSTPIYWYGKWRGVWDDVPPGIGLTVLLHLSIVQTLILCGITVDSVWLFAVIATISFKTSTAIMSRVYPKDSRTLGSESPSSPS